jgi:hypothetical protein
MEAVRGQVNWSAVASSAFEAKLLELELASKRGKMDKSDIVKRMKAAQETDTEDYEDGKAAGRAWASERAAPKELRRLEKHIEKFAGEFTVWYDVDSFEAADEVLFAMRPKLRNAATTWEFWQDAIGDEWKRIEDAEFLHGFGDGALEVWEQVSREL